MKLNIFRSCILIVLCISLASWGEKGHNKINSSSTSFFPNRIKNLKDWNAGLTEHASDPDKVRNGDRSEANRHFIDIDNFPDFVATHKIIEDQDAAKQAYTFAFMVKNGRLPWATDSTYKALVQNFKKKEWKNAMLTAAYLGHYVGDGHMPLHLTNNYDGKLTSQSGIHSRYESTMVSKFLTEINYKSSKVKKIKDVKTYIFNYIYDNYKYKDSLLMADKLAFTAAGNEYSDLYYQNLWKSTKGFTIKLLEDSSKSMAALIYTAWIEAGKPKIPLHVASLN
jgi:hypothetical protein